MAFKPGRTAHTILARLKKSPCMAGYLFRALGYDDPVPQNIRKRFWRRIDAMKKDALIYQGADKFFELLPAGAALLEELNLQHPEPGTAVPTVRVFDYQPREKAA